MTLSRAKLIFAELQKTPMDQIQINSLFNCAEVFLEEIDRLKPFEEWHENRDWKE